MKNEKLTFGVGDDEKKISATESHSSGIGSGSDGYVSTVEMSFGDSHKRSFVKKEFKGSRNMTAEEAATHSLEINEALNNAGIKTLPTFKMSDQKKDTIIMTDLHKLFPGKNSLWVSTTRDKSLDKNKLNREQKLRLFDETLEESINKMVRDCELAAANGLFIDASSYLYGIAESDNPSVAKKIFSGGSVKQLKVVIADNVGVTKENMKEMTINKLFYKNLYTVLISLLEFAFMSVKSAYLNNFEKRVLKVVGKKMEEVEILLRNEGVDGEIGRWLGYLQNYLGERAVSLDTPEYNPLFDSNSNK